MRLSYTQTLHAITILFLLVFPKSGVLLGSIPIYISTLWGTFLVVYCAFNARHTSPQLLRLYFALAFCAIAAWLINILRVPHYSLGILAQLIFNLTAILSLSLAFYPIDGTASLVRLMRYFKLGYYAIILYGTLQMAFGAQAVAINNLTATYASSFTEILERHNVLHGLSDETNVVSKIFSTYQNGNLFGVALVLCLPVALAAEKNAAMRLAMFGLCAIVCVFTASAGAMLGLAAVAFFYVLQAIKVGTISKTTGLLLSIVPVVAVGYIITNGLPSQLETMLNSRLLDRNFSSNIRWVKVGRWWQEIGENPLLFFHGSLVSKTTVFEVLPIALTQFYGAIVAFLFYWFLLSAIDFKRFHFYKIGVLSYLFMSIADGGLWLTPTSYLLGLNIAACRAMDRYPNFLSHMPTPRVTWHGRPIFG